MRVIVFFLLAAATCFAQLQLPLSSSDRIATKSITNNPSESDIIVKTGEKKVSVQLSLYLSQAGALVVYKNAHPTNTWVATNLVTELVTNRSSYASTQCITNALTNIVTQVWTRVQSGNNLISVTNSAANRTNVTTYRYYVPFAFTLTNITVPGVTNDAYLAGETTNEWTNATTATNTRELTLMHAYRFTFTNTYINHFANDAYTNTIVTNIVTTYMSNLFRGNSKYKATSVVTNTITNMYIVGYTNVITNVTYNYFTNACTLGMITLTSPARVAKTNSFRLFSGHVVTNTGTLVTTNYYSAGINKRGKIALEKNTVYLFRVNGSTNTTFNFTFSELP